MDKLQELSDFLGTQIEKLNSIKTTLIPKDEMGDDLCKYCPLQKKGVYSVNGGYVAGCEGSRCNDAYENYLELGAGEKI